MSRIISNCLSEMIKARSPIVPRETGQRKIRAILLAHEKCRCTHSVILNEEDIGMEVQELKNEHSPDTSKPAAASHGSRIPIFRI